MALFRNDTADYIIAGLGNPGEEYMDTRHNAGFHAIDALGRDLDVNYWRTKHGCLSAEVEYKDKLVVLAKPQSFMNTSGGPLKQLSKAYNVAPTHIIVIHDEMDLEPGQVRIKHGGGHAGHNGLRSIIEKLASNDFDRVRVGIGKPLGRTEGADYVLESLRGEALEAFEADCAIAADAALAIIALGIDKAMNRYNRKS